MVEGILDYSRLSPHILAIRSLGSGRALADALTNLETPISEHVATITHDPMPMVLADQVQMTQLFQNLIGNGIKYCSSRAPTIHVSASLDHDQVTFRIPDNGIGIHPTDVDRIFEMFTRVQVSDTIAGSGIGLASCKRIIERLGGFDPSRVDGGGRRHRRRHAAQGTRRAALSLGGSQREGGRITRGPMTFHACEHWLESLQNKGSTYERRPWDGGANFRRVDSCRTLGRTDTMRPPCA